TFSFRIRARAVDPPADTASDGDPLDVSGGSAIPPMRLLLVEDNLVNRKVALLVLRKLGYVDVDTAIDGLEALAAVHARDYDVVLMDVQMPALDGLGCTRRIRAELPAERQPQIIAMTANAMTGDRAACVEAGMDDYLPKPIHLASLAQALLDAARRRGIAVTETDVHPREPATESPEARAQRIGAQILAGGGEMGELMRRIDWSQTPVGPPYTWPQSLRTSLSILLAQRHPIFLWWGRELVQFYNDAYRPMLGQSKHPRAMGQRGRECFAEIWDQVGPMADAVLNRAESSWVERGLLCLDRNGLLEECYFTYACSPIRDESGDIGGVFVACSENTADVISARRSALLLEIDERALLGDTLEQQRPRVGSASSDLPFTLVYRVDERSGSAHLVWTTGLVPGSPEAPIELRDDSSAWGVHESLRTQRVLQQGPPAPLPSLPPWPEPPRQALIHPLGHWGVLVAGLSPRLIPDEAYRTFVFRLAQRLRGMRELHQG
ncbi:MAG: response regulator, partial [Panacagrimonas sp.]